MAGGGVGAHFTEVTQPSKHFMQIKIIDPNIWQCSDLRMSAP